MLSQNGQILGHGIPDSDQQPLSTSTSVPLSYEQVALEDMIYHAPTLIGPTITEDLSQAMNNAQSGNWLNAWTDRAAAWYEIVFNSNKYKDASLQNRQFRDGSEFGLYSQGGRWSDNTSQDPNLGVYQPVGNVPSSGDQGEEALSTLRFLQDHATTMNGYLSTSGFLPTTTPSQVINDYENPAASALNSLYATPYGLSFDANHIIATQALNGVVQAPTDAPGYMLIGAQFSTIPDSNSTNGYQYGSAMMSTITGDSSGGDVLLGVASRSV